MRAERWPVPERDPEAWDPFMEGLFRRVRRERRVRLMTRLAAAACFVLAFWTGVSVGTERAAPPLRAEIPTTEAPLFQPDPAGGDQGAIVLVCAR